MGIIKVWDVVSGQAILTLQGHEDGVHHITFSPDGKRIASASYDGTMRLWETINVPTLQGHSTGVWAVAFSPDGKLLASGDTRPDNTIKLWSTSDYKEIATLTGHTDAVVGVAFSPDGTLLASGGGDQDNTIKLWNISDGREIKTFPTDHDFGICHITFGPDGKLLASTGCGDHRIKLWNIADGKEQLTITTPKMVRQVAFSPDGTRLVSANEDGVRLWNVADGRELMMLQPHQGDVWSVSFSPDGKRIAAAIYNIINFWDSVDGHLIKKIEAPLIFGNRKIVFSPDGTLLASRNTGSSRDIDKITFWDVENGNKLAILSGHSDGVGSIAFSPDGKLLASGGADKTIKLWNLDLDDLLKRGCDWLHGYLKNNPDVSAEDRGLCDDILKQ